MKLRYRIDHDSSLIRWKYCNLFWSKQQLDKTIIHTMIKGQQYFGTIPFQSWSIKRNYRHWT